MTSHTPDEEQLREQVNNLLPKYCDKKDVEAVVAFISAHIKQKEREARKDQTFDVIQSLVKAKAISDSLAANTLALHIAFLELELQQPALPRVPKPTVELDPEIRTLVNENFADLLWKDDKPADTKVEDK